MPTAYNYGTNAGGSSDTPYPAGSGHAAGWRWAQDKGITDASDCGGQGSFKEGCEAYCEAQNPKSDDGAT